MGFDDFFDGDHKHNKHGFDNHHRHDKHYQSSDYSTKDSDLKYILLNKLQSNPKLKVMLISTAIIVIIILVIMLIFLMPVIIKLLDFISQNGIQGVIENIWKGTK